MSDITVGDMGINPYDDVAFEMAYENHLQDLAEQEGTIKMCSNCNQNEGTIKYGEGVYLCQNCINVVMGW